MVPKNASLIVKRVPAIGGVGILSRLRARSVLARSNNCVFSRVCSSNNSNILLCVRHSSAPEPILVPAKAEPTPESTTAPASAPAPASTAAPHAIAPSKPVATTTPSPDSTSNAAAVTDSELDELKKIQDLQAAAASEAERYLRFVPRSLGSQSDLRFALIRNRRGNKVWVSDAKRPIEGVAPLPTAPKRAPPLPSNYVCNRCGRGGHHIKNCPTNGDPKFDKKDAAPKVHPIPLKKPPRFSRQCSNHSPRSLRFTATCSYDGSARYSREESSRP